MRPQRLLMSALLAAGLVPAAASAQYTVLQPIATPPLVAVQVVEPTTPGYPGWDLRYWKPAAVTTFNSCLSGFLGSGANCLASARRVYGDVCQAPSAAQCLDSQYFTTWCGRAEYAARGTSTT